jgi:hypothetical protein
VFARRAIVFRAPVSSSATSALRDPAANKIRVKSISFECEPPRSSYKTLFLGTSLGAALSRKSTEKIAPVGLKNQECERGRGGEKAPIRYVPDRDPVQEALDLKPETLKCTLANGSETRVTVWSGHGTNEQFVLHVNKAYSTAKKMGLIPACDDAERAYDSKKGEWKAVLRELADDPLSKTEKEKKTAESLSLKADMLALRTKMTDSALEVFQLYANLLTEEARQPWDLIVKEQTESNPFHDIFGVERKKSPGKTSESFRRCQLLHLQSCFAHDAGKNLKFYISNCLKKPNKVRVRQFVQRVMQLNNYVEDLPCLYYSPSASTMTQQVYSFTDAELACHILRMCPLKWQDQYHLLEKCYPEGVKPLLLILERIEVAHPVDERQSSSKPARAQGAEQPSKKFAPGARIPKKPKQARTEYVRVEKNCELCKKHGGAHTTHNTTECRRYNKDGTPTRGTFGQAARKSREDSRPKKSYAQVLARMAKLEKSLKKANKKDKKRRRRDESDSDSDSS